ncbi:MAG: hypothetical protein LQ343_005762 [Gyalolechia ehrenbergii]|nr:MAG: hypothetical protein LQ343_005762 [Gyalolechia ehrenbergii]
MEHNTSLGTLAWLPRELRDQIWVGLLMGGHFTPLQTSRQVHAEISSILSNKDLIFQVSLGYRYKSWINVESSFGARWLLQDLVDAKKRGFDKLPFEKLDKIRINVAAPNGIYPGQIVCLYNKCMDLAELLENSKQALPDIEIKLLDTEFAKWNTKNQTRMHVGLISDLDFTDDHELLLFAFSRLRNARSAKIYVLVEYDGENHFIWNMASSMMLGEPFGTWSKPDEPWNDEETQEDADNIFTDLDLALDLLLGPTAEMMRLDRFSSWYTDEFHGESRYERRYERIIKTWTDNSWEQNFKLKNLRWRYGAMRAFDPDRLNHLGDQSAKKDVGLANKWDQDWWHERYRYELRHWQFYGIPTMYSNAFFRKLKYAWGASAKYKYESVFMAKLLRSAVNDNFKLDASNVGWEVLIHLHTDHCGYEPVEEIENYYDRRLTECSHWPCEWIHRRISPC